MKKSKCAVATCDGLATWSAWSADERDYKVPLCVDHALRRMQDDAGPQDLREWLRWAERA